MSRWDLDVRINNYLKPFPDVSKPTIIGYMDLENLKFAKFIYDRKVTIDLNLQIDKGKHKPMHLDVKLTTLLTFLLENKTRLNFPLSESLENAHIICFRGLMTCIAQTPYENKDPWKVVAVLHKGSIYLCIRDTDEKLKRIQNMTQKEIKCTAWGHKFEQFMLSDSPESEPNPDEPVDETKEFNLVFMRKLNHHTIVYGAEMDGIQCDKSNVLHPPSPNENPEVILQYLSRQEFIELKTNRHIEFRKQNDNFRFKTIKWWCQSYLADVKTIACGFRNDDGIVEELKVYPVKELPRIAKNYWKPSVCMNFLDAFFDYVKKCIATEIKNKHGTRALNSLQSLPMISLMFEWHPGMSVEVNRKYSHEKDPILPEWFTDSYK